MLDGFFISTIGGGILLLFMNVYFKVKNNKIKNTRKIHEIIINSKRSFNKNHFKVAYKRLTYISKYL